MTSHSHIHIQPDPGIHNPERDRISSTKLVIHKLLGIKIIHPLILTRITAKSKPLPDRIKGLPDTVTQTTRKNTRLRRSIIRILSRIRTNLNNLPLLHDHHTLSIRHSDPAAAGNNIITPMLIGRPGRRPLRPLHNHHFFIHSLTVKKLLPLIRQRTTRCTHSRSDKTHKSNPFLKIHSYLQFYDIPKLSSLSFLIVTSLLHEFYQKSTYFYTILQLSYSHHIHNLSTSTQSICAGIKGYSPITSAILGTSATPG